MRVGLNGFGRIGRSIFRNNLLKKFFNIVAINEINPDNCNLAYQLNYDTLYGQLKSKFIGTEVSIYESDYHVRVFHEKFINDVPWEECDVDIVIDATGVLENALRANIARKIHKLKKILITHCPECVDFTMVLGANEDKFDSSRHNIISTSICDATAIAPVFTVIQNNLGIEKGYVTTLHPWLNYQNLMDGPASSWSHPGEIYHHYALGRSVIGNIIPKPTTAIEATCDVVEGVSTDIIGSFSYRTPTAIVGSADITLIIKENISKEQIIKLFVEAEHNQKWDVFHNNEEPLVSLDFKRSNFSAIIDHRWTDVIGNNMLKLVLWYDNEWAYSSRVVDQVNYITKRIRNER